MKKPILTLILITLISGYLKAQQHLPDTLILKLSKAQVLAISAKVDSMAMLLTNTSTAPSGQVAEFNARTQAVFSPMWFQVNKQLIADKPKEVKPSNK